MDSPSHTANPRMKRRSSSMFNLVDHKNLIEKDLEQSKRAVIRKNNLTRKNYRNELLVRNRNIDFNHIYEESPQINRAREPINAESEIKVEKMNLMLMEPKQEKVEIELPAQPNQNRIANIKNKINTLKNNFRSIIGANNNAANKKQEQVVVVKAEPQTRKPPLPKFNNENDVRQPVAVSSCANFLFNPWVVYQDFNTVYGLIYKDIFIQVLLNPDHYCWGHLNNSDLNSTRAAKIFITNLRKKQTRFGILDDF